MGRPFFYLELNGMERDGTEQERNDKKEERERNDLAEGPRSRMERNDFKKVGTCPALLLTRTQSRYYQYLNSYTMLLTINASTWTWSRKLSIASIWTESRKPSMPQLEYKRIKYQGLN